MARKVLHLGGKVLLADREYIGTQWFGTLREAGLGFVIRLRKGNYEQELEARGRSVSKLENKAKARLGKLVWKKFTLQVAPEDCTGCGLCPPACPVDCIVGGPKAMHTVIDELCTGCELCIPPCPVDCIDMVFMPEFSAWDQTQAHAARTRMQTREIRLERQKEEQWQDLDPIDAPGT